MLDAELVLRIRQIWEASRAHAARSVNSVHVAANWLIGQQIVEAEQRGSERAVYGEGLLKRLSQALSRDFGTGFSVSALQYMRAFHLTYPALLGDSVTSEVRTSLHQHVAESKIQHALRVILLEETHHDWKPGHLHTSLSWTHYRTLLKVSRSEVRAFYEIEAVRNGWSARQLERQLSTLLYDRIARSRDRAGVLALANEGLVPHKPSDVVKDPYSGLQHP